MSRLLPALSAALAAAGLIGTAQAQVQTAGTLLVNVDATATALGSLANIPNSGTMGGFFEARGGAAATPIVAIVNGNGTRGIRFDGDDYLQHVATLGGGPLPADPTLTGVNPTASIEVWVLNPTILQEETVVSWGHRGGPDGSNMSFNYGWDGAFGAVGHWGAPDIGWDSSAGSGNPQGNPTMGVWHHLVYTYDGTIQRLYSDGVLKNSETVGLNTWPIPPITIGAQMDNDTVVTAGLRGSMTIARLRVHSDTLSAAQVLNNYNFEKPAISDGGAPLPFGPSHRYSFNNAAGAAASGAVITDSVGTAHGTVRGAGATFTGSRLTLPGGASSTQAYVDLPNGLLSVNGVGNGGSGEITVEGFVRNNGTRNWSRIYDFGNGTAGEINNVGGAADGLDYWFLSATEGTGARRHNTSIRNLIAPTGSDIGVGWDTINENRDYHFAVTWRESSGQILSYENGTLVSTLNVNAVNDTMASIQDVNVWLGRSNWTGDENFQGEYDDFRIYPRVLPPEQVRASYFAGANNLALANPVSIGTQPQNQIAQELGNATFTANVLGFPPLGIQWFRAPATVIAGANGNSLTLTAVPLSDNGAQFFLIASNFIPGTGSFFATSQVATLTVNADVIRPTLVSAAASGVSNILVTFSETINAGDAGTVANFTVSAAGTNITVLSAAASGPNGARLTLNAPFGCAYYTVTVSGVRDVASAQNPILPGSQIGFLSLASPSLNHRYTFNNAPTASAGGVIVPDLVGTAHAEVKSAGSGTTLTGTRVTLAGGGSASAPYVDLPNGLLSVNSTNNGGSGAISVEGWFKNTGNQSWSRIFDFGSNQGGELNSPGGGGAEGIDYFFLSAQIGGDVNARRLELANRDGANLGAAIADYAIGNFNQDFHYVVTWDERTGALQTYENGNLVTSANTVAPMNQISDVNVWLGRSNWTVDANTQGEYDEFRLYNRILTPTEITQNRSLGPDYAIGALQTLTLNVPNVTMSYPGPTQQASAIAGFAGGTNLDLSASGCVLFESSAPTVLTVSPGGVLTVITSGVATITARFSGLTATKLITILGDVTGPTLVSARVNSPTTIEVLYNEVVEPNTAADIVNYTVRGPDGPIGVTSVDLHASQNRVTLNLVSRLPLGFVTVEVNDVEDLAPTHNVIIPHSTIGTYFLVVNGLTHRYSFNSFPSANASAAIVPDLAGTADGEVKGSGAAFLGSQLRINGGPSGSAAYVDLPNNLLSVNSTNRGGPGAATIEGWVKVTGVQNWGRIFDFGSSDIGGRVGGEVTGVGGGGEGLDYFMLSATRGTESGFRRFEFRNEDPLNGGIVTVDHATTNFNRDCHFVVTWDERTGVIRTYENGAQVSTVTTDDNMSQVNDVNVWLGRSNWTGDANMQGEFDEFRIHRRVMPASEVGFSFALGPDANIGTLNSVVLQGPASIPATNSAQLNFFGIFSNVPGLDLSGTPAVRYLSSNPSIVSVDPTGVIHANLCGSANITAWIAGVPGISNRIAITVLNCPPLPQPDGGATRVGVPVTLPISKILRNDFDPEGAVVTFIGAASASTNGGAVVTTATDLTYTPLPGFAGIDRIAYTVGDGTNTASSFIEILVVAGNLPSLNQVSLTPIAGGGFVVRFAGIPGRTYKVDRATSLSGPWTTVSTSVAPLHGITEYQDNTPPQPNAFYRTSLP